MNLKKALILSGIAVLFSLLNLFSQNKDSLQTLLNSNEPDSNKIKLLNSWSRTLYKLNPKAGLIYSQEALYLSKITKWKPGQFESTLILGNCYLNLFKKDSAIYFLEDALLISDEIGDKLGRGRCLATLGVVYYKNAKYIKSLKYFEESYAIFEELGDSSKLSKVLYHIGNVYQAKAEIDKSVEYYSKSLQISEKCNYIDDQISALNNIGAIYIDLYEPPNYKAGMFYFLKSLSLANLHQIPTAQIEAFGNIGNIYKKTHEYSLAILYHNKSLRIAQQRNDKENELKALINLGSIFLDDSCDYTAALERYRKVIPLINDADNLKSKTFNNMGFAFINLSEYDSANYYVHEGLSLANKIGSREYQKESWELLTRIYENKNQCDSALASYKKYNILKDSILVSETKSKIDSITAKYIYEEKMAKYSSKKLQKITSSFAWITAILSIVCGLLLVYLIRRRSKKTFKEIFTSDFYKKIIEIIVFCVLFIIYVLMLMRFNPNTNFLPIIYSFVGGVFTLILALMSAKFKELLETK